MMLRMMILRRLRRVRMQVALEGLLGRLRGRTLNI